MLKSLKVSPAMHVVIHSVLGLSIGAIAAGLTAAGQTVLNTGANAPVVLTAGLMGCLVSLFHSFVPLPNSPEIRQAMSDVEQELRISPALVAQLEPLVKLAAPILAQELLKIRPIGQAAQQAARQPVQPQPITYPQQMTGGNYNPPGTATLPPQSLLYDLAGQQTQSVPNWPASAAQQTAGVQYQQPGHPG